MLKLSIVSNECEQTNKRTNEIRKVDEKYEIEAEAETKLLRRFRERKIFETY